MIKLNPGTTAAGAKAALEEAVRAAENVLGAGGSPVERLNGYSKWSTRQTRALRPHLAPAAIDELTLGRRSLVKHALRSLAPSSFDPGTLAEAVDAELRERIDDLKNAISDLDETASQWGEWHSFTGSARPYLGIVLDTNVLLRHCESLAEVNRHADLEVLPNRAIALGIPTVVIEELDNLKTSTAVMHLGEGAETKVATRTLARKALKVLDQLFPGSWTRAELRQRAGIHEGELHAVLMIEDLDHARLPGNDAEIIDSALRLRPYTADVAVATYDRSMLFRARNAGLKAFKPDLAVH